jgi:spore coat protein CotF
VSQKIVSQQQQDQQNKQGFDGRGLLFTDNDALQIALNESKHMAQSVNTFILEATNDQLRRDYMTVLGDIYSQQKEIVDLMQQKGYYSIKTADPQAIAQAQNKFSGQWQETLQ